MGELDWMPVQARREILRLRYWGKIVGEGKRNPGSLVHAVYREGRLRVEEGRAKSQREWCVETKRLLKEVGLEEYWESEEVGEQNEWALLVKRMVFRREEAKWREGMWRGGKRGMALTTLERYARVKRTLRNEWFLDRSRVWVSRWVRMRGGVQELEVTVGRRRAPQVPRKDRVCRQCHLGEVEDEEHFWLHCPRWAEQREGLWNDMFEVDDMATGGALQGSDRAKLDWLMQGGSKKVKEVALRGMVKWMHARRRCE
jgi:hypothetical protein